ncbi:hypothetical protein DXX93_02755 [Thalassotalea euphylliae]|uniref:DUF3718 domain-containing protein n=1 Tax=Thalassotalea euphylliae TaxID=1655234 RepID=A0A3E0TME8_9GAMM|nr:hypothetical protein [Thalassotalea euphylliae]REL25573.1 hypothetical protein DXX93_02755 [Thalassotalea euphylliae]
MKTFIGAVALVTATLSSQAFAAKLQFVGKDTSTETSLCVLAAEQGYQAVVAQLGLNKSQLNGTQCNGVSLKEFAASLKAPKTAVTHKTVVVSGNQSMESQLCLKAVKEGVQAVGHRVSSLKCNGQSVSSFVKSVKRS